MTCLLLVALTTACVKRAHSHKVVAVSQFSARKHCVFPVLVLQTDRICVIEVKLQDTTRLIVGVYLPSSDHSKEEYGECLIELENVINTHARGPVAILGDFNAHVGSEAGEGANDDVNTQGKMLLDFADRNGLFFTSLVSAASGPRYTYSSGTTRSTIDYCLLDSASIDILHSCVCHHPHPLNFSNHLPITAILMLSAE